MSTDRWLFRPRKDGAVDIELKKLSGKSASTFVKPDELSALMAGLATAFRDARILAGHPPGPDQFEGTRVPLVPDGVGLLHPAPNKRHLVLLFGEAHVVIDISDLDTEPLARALLMASADGKPQ